MASWSAELLPLNSLLALWTLLAVYHRAYDTIVTIFFMVVLFVGTLHMAVAQARSARAGSLLAIFAFPDVLAGRDSECLYRSGEEAETLIRGIEGALIFATGSHVGGKFVVATSSTKRE